MTWCSPALCKVVGVSGTLKCSRKSDPGNANQICVSIKAGEKKKKFTCGIGLRSCDQVWSPGATGSGTVPG